MLKNKLALITGANSGIGLSVLKKFSENGANIIACSRNKDEKFDKIIYEISEKYKNKITQVHFDMSKENEIDAAVEKINSMSSCVRYCSDCTKSCARAYDRDRSCIARDIRSLHLCSPVKSGLPQMILRL